MAHGNFALFIPLAGCPYQCIYCDQAKISGTQTMSPVIAADELAKHTPLWQANGTKGQLAFFGGTFTGLPTEQMKEYLAVARPYIENGTFDGIRISTRPDAITPEILSVLKENRVTHIELGVQSTDNTVLSAAGRGYTAADVEKSAELILRFGFTLGEQMMVGLPGDTEQKSLQTAHDIVRHGAAETRIYPTLVIRNTKLDHLRKTGKYQPWQLQPTVELCAKLCTYFEQNGVTVLKVGLHSGAVEKDITAGPFHPAFGQLVSAGRCLDAMTSFCNKQGICHDTLYVTPEKFDVSDIIGQHRDNVTKLKEKFDVTVKICHSDLTFGDHHIIL